MAHPVDPLSEHDLAQRLLGAWVLHVSDPDESRLVEAHVARCAVCAHDLADLTETAGELAGLVPQEEPPPDVWAGIESAVAAERRAPRAVDPYNELVVQLAELLADLRDEEWQVEATAGWSVLDLVAHLAAVDGVLAAALRVPGRVVADGDLDERTAQVVERARRRPPGETVQEWRRQAAELAVAVASGGEGVLARTVPFAGLDLPVRVVILDRAFETWIHAEDIARATGRSIAGPPPPHVALLADTAVQLLPGVLAMTGRTAAGSARVALTGPGGGTWDVTLGQEPATHVVELSMDVMEFCYLVGGRRDPASIPRQVRGDVDRADDLVFAAAALARP